MQLKNRKGSWAYLVISALFFTTLYAQHFSAAAMPTAQGDDNRSAAQNLGYRFRTIDLPTDPFGTPTQTDLQFFSINNDGMMTAQYQNPRSGVCCGLTADFFNNMHMAVRLQADWTNIDVQGADTTAGTNVNAREEIALTYRSGGGPWHSAIYDLRRRDLVPFADLPGYPGGLMVSPGFNDRGRVAADVFDAAGHSHGFVGDLHHSEVFDYPDPNVTDTFAQMESNSGIVVGGYVLADGSVHAYKRVRGEFTTIDPPGSILAIALAINDEGAIVGGSMGADGRIFGFLLNEGRFIHFRVPNSTLTVPWFIDDGGQISGTYSNSDNPLFNGIFHGFAAKPVSEEDEGSRSDRGRMQ